MVTDSHKIVPFAALLLAAVLLVHIMVEGRMILLPLVWAGFISLLILPAARWLEKKSIPRPIAIITVLVVVTVVISLILYLLSIQIVGLLRDAPTVTDKLESWITALQLMIEKRFGISHEVMTQQIFNSASQMLNDALLNLRNSVFSVFQTLTLISVIPLYIFFMVYYRDLFYEGALRLLKSYERKAAHLISKVSRVVQRYLTGLMAVTAIMAVLFYIVLYLLGISYALFFAVFLAVFNLIPYVGVIIASLAVILYTIATTDTLFYPVAVLLSLWIIQIVENNLITPYILGSRVRLNPLVALIAIFAGGSIWGISGMILFIPLLGVLKSIFDEIDNFKPVGLMMGDIQGKHSEEE